MTKPSYVRQPVGLPTAWSVLGHRPSKLHIGVDASTGKIIAATLTRKDVDDASEVGSLLQQLEGPLASRLLLAVISK